ncbi:MAG: magnesium transporter, partial [Bryobacteraceae bacterium]|nr:magnesium transporter [Bryobacteraceae bacterium]
MAVDELRGRDFLRVIYREARVGLLLGLTVAAIGLLPVWLLFGRSLAAVVGLTLIAVCTLASVVGATMPLVAERIHIDPAVVSAPAVTTVVDAAGLLVYFAIARAILAVS